MCIYNIKYCDIMSIVSAVILSGGNAKRMGGEKPFRKLNNGYMIENILRVIIGENIPYTIVFKHLDELSKEDISKQIYLIEKYKGCNQTITWDIVSNKGPLVGIFSGMRLSNSEWIITLPCDMPFVNSSSLNNLVSQIPMAISKKYNCIIPKHENGHIEPLFSIYHKSTTEVLEELINKILIKKKSLPIRSFIEKLRPLYIPVNKIDPTSRTFININTHNDLNLLNR